jgi:hypothetical protein
MTSDESFDALVGKVKCFKCPVEPPRQGLNGILRTLLRSGGDLLNVNRLLRRVEFSRQHYMHSGEVDNGFRIFDNPDCLIVVRYKDGSLRFPFRVPDRSTSAPAFLHAIRAAGLCVLDSATLIADPAGTRCVPLLRR